MREFEMKFHWDDQEEAFHRKTRTHRQDGMLKTWKLDHETDEEYQKRTRRMINDKLIFLNGVKYRGGKFGEVDSYKFR